MSIADFLSLVRRPNASESGLPTSPKRKSPVEATTSELPATEAELRTALARLDGESAAAEQVVRDGARKRDELLLDGTDAEIQALDLQIDHCHLQVERLGRVRELLADRLRVIELEDARARWLSLVGRYVDAGRHYSSLLKTAEIARAALHDIRTEASGSFREQCDNALPYPVDFNRLGADSVAAVVESIGRSAPNMLAPTTPVLANVQFLKWSMVGPPRQEAAYQVGQQAGFPPDVAWRLIDAGFAEWAGPIPPRPGPPPPLPQAWVTRFGEGALSNIDRAVGRREPG